MMTEEKTIREFMEELSSKAPVPGGGGASAMAGALGSALGQMVVNLTIGKKKYAEVETLMQGYLAKLGSLQEELIRLIERDAAVFAPLAQCYSLPAGTQEEKDYKAGVMEERLLEASYVPLEIMKKAVDMLDILDILAEKGSRLAVSDVGVAVQFVRTAILGAVMNVYINTKAMQDKEKAEALNKEAERLIKLGTTQADVIYDKVRSQLL